jgi:adenine-specific DNA-methyltransferase
MDYKNLSKEELIKALEEALSRQGLVWNKKVEPVLPYTVDEVNEKNIKGTGSQHLLFEGDNIQALDYLNKHYKNKIKLFLIDPPYNTGESYMKYKDNRNNKGKFRFTDWLNFLQPRIDSSYELGTEDSLYAFFIDDFNVDYLKALCDQKFGTQNFLGRVVWKCRAGTGISDQYFSANHEYVLFYCKNKAKFSFLGMDKDLSKYKNPDNDPRGPWKADCLTAAKPGGDVYYPITDPKTGIQYLPSKGRYWPYNRISMAKKISESRIIFPKKPGGTPSLKRFKNELQSSRKPLSSWWDEYLTSHGSKALKELFDGEKVFDYPKPVELMKFLIEQVCYQENDIVLDFFAGSGTTAQALIESNIERNINRQAILVTNNENSICEKVTYERIKRVLAKRHSLDSLTYYKIKTDT